MSSVRNIFFFTFAFIFIFIFIPVPISITMSSNSLAGISAIAGTFSIVGGGRDVRVAKVIDGDTFRTDTGEKIRLLAINTPEIAHGTQAAQPLGKSASRQLHRLIAGRIVRLRFDSDKKDRYNRTLAQVYLPDGLWINAELLRLGFAHVYTFAPNFRYVGDLLAIEQEAIQARRGLWNTKRFAKLSANQVTAKNIGQYRVIDGFVHNINRNGFGFQFADSLGNNKLKITIPRKYRQYFANQPPTLHDGQHLRVRGIIRAGRGGARLYLAIHSPHDLKALE